MISNGRFFTVFNLTGRKLNGISKKECIVDVPYFVKPDLENAIYSCNKSKNYNSSIIDSFVKVFNSARIDCLGHNPSLFRFKVLFDRNIPDKYAKPLEEFFYGANIELMYFLLLNEVACEDYSLNDFVFKISETELILRPYREKFEAVIPKKIKE